MRTIEQRRFDNLHLLLVGNTKTQKALSQEIGIGRSNFSTIINGGANISGSYARKIEAGFKKPFGWMDEDHIANIDIQYSYEIVQIIFTRIQDSGDLYSLFESFDADGKATLFDQLYILFCDPVARDLAPSTLFNILGIKQNDKAPDKRDHDRPANTHVE